MLRTLRQLHSSASSIAVSLSESIAVGELRLKIDFSPRRSFPACDVLDCQQTLKAFDPGPHLNLFVFFLNLLLSVCAVHKVHDCMWIRRMHSSEQCHSKINRCSLVHEANLPENV